MTTTLEQKAETLLNNLLKTNPTIALADGNSISAAEFDVENEAHLAGLAVKFKDQFIELINSNQTDESADDVDSDDEADELLDLDDEDDDMEDEDEVELTREEKQQAQIDSLTKEANILRAKMMKKFSAVTFRELESRTKELNDLKNRARREAAMKQRHREKFLANSWGDAADFDRLWNSTLRDEVMLSEVKTSVIMRRHSVYNAFGS